MQFFNETPEPTNPTVGKTKFHQAQLRIKVFMYATILLSVITLTVALLGQTKFAVVFALTTLMSLAWTQLNCIQADVDLSIAQSEGCELQLREISKKLDR